jgi:S-sulfo-L-cysteine synthase (O-acetyl-L-serine-dependent)
MTKYPPKATLDLHRIGKEIGHTPLLKLSSLSTDRVEVYAKAEWYQLGNSVKARAAFRIISEAILAGLLEGRTLLDASSGNTAIAYASICAKLQIPLAICLPANASQKRKDILRALGTELHLTSELEGTDGAQAVARSMAEAEPERYFLADQYANPANWKAHYHGTAEEIWSQTDGIITHFVTGLGTTGSFVGNAAKLKALNPDIRTVALQPDSPMHLLEGWKHLETAVVPAIFSEEHIDGYASVDSTGALDMIRFIAKHEGLLLSPSSAANLLGAKQLANTLKEGRIVTLLPDDASKYDEILQMIQ